MDFFCTRTPFRDLRGKGLEKATQNSGTISVLLNDNPLLALSGTIWHSVFASASNPALAQVKWIFCQGSAQWFPPPGSLFETWPTERILLFLTAHKLCRRNEIVLQPLTQCAVMRCLLLWVFHYVLTSFRRVTTSYSSLVLHSYVNIC